ncbi:hypothetical protein ACFQL0_11140 [Haloplanus litoreus]|uniref:hypothetical protein n=1 Tax=Haloplanus litoreus TaxID=767515 RepID=UPI003620FC74
MTVVGSVVDDGVDPLVVADGTPTRALVRSSKTSLAGLSIGGFALVVGVWLVLVG